MTAIPPETPPPAGPDDGDKAKSLDELANRQVKVESKLDELIDLVKGAKPGEPGKKDDPAAADPSLEARVKEELARREKTAADEKLRGEHEDLKARVAKLGETPPRQPGSRRTKLLGWGDGR